jgi:hypothetical protein
MRRATVTIPDGLEKALDSYARDLEFPPSLAPTLRGNKTAAEMVIEDRR